MLNEEQYFADLTTFQDNPLANMVLIRDAETIYDFERTSGLQIGVIDNSPYYRIRLDLYRNSSGKLFRYCNVEYPKDKRGAATLTILCHKNTKYVLFEQHFRIFPGCYCLEIPRGFAQAEDISSFHTAIRELQEETNIRTDSNFVKSMGSILVDSGLTNNRVDLFALELHMKSPPVLSNNDEEDIDGYIWMPLSEVVAKIADGTISDSFSICAVCRYMCLHSSDR